MRNSGEPQPHVVDVDETILLEARRDKEATYPELASLWSQSRRGTLGVAVGSGESTGSSSFPDAAGRSRMGASLDTYVEHSVRHVFCHVSGGTSVARDDVRDSRGCAIVGRHFVS